MAEILQYKFDRLFFSTGRDMNIFPSSTFKIILGDKTISSGIIEYSMPGLSYSFPLPGLTLDKPLQEYRAVIETAAIDSLNPIRIGRSNNFLLAHDSLPQTTVSGNPLKIYTFKDEQELFFAFSQNDLDLCLSYLESQTYPPDVTRFSFLTPQVAVLIPNLSRDFNAAGFLTTSMYYRFDSRRLDLIFDGDSLASSPSFMDQSDSAIREFAYDPESGRKLLDYLESRPGKITLTYGHDNLNKTAEYFARILNRDKIKVTVKQSVQPGDLHLDWIPIKEDSLLSTLKVLVERLYLQTLDNSPARRKLDIIRTHLDEAFHSDTESRRLYYANLAERSLKGDLGVFPLFRSRIFVSSTNHIQWPVMDTDPNWTDFSKLVRLKLPSLQRIAP